MKKLIALSLISFCLSLHAREARLLVEAEQFQFPGYWQIADDGRALGGRLLIIETLPTAQHSPLEALTAVRVPSDGLYRVWVRSLDFPLDRPRTRRFKLAVDDEPFDAFAGTHGRAGYHWERLGERQLGAGEHLLALRETGASHARCDAVYLTTGSENPEDEEPRHLHARRVRPLTLPFTPKKPDAVSVYGEVPLATGTNGTAPTARLYTDKLRVEFRTVQTTDGRPWVTRITRVRSNASDWTALPGGDGREALFMQHVARASANCSRFVTFKSLIYLAGETVFQGKRHSIPGPATNPFEAAPADRYYPSRVRQMDNGHVELVYTRGTTEIRTVWSLDADDPCGLRVAATFRAPEAGFYSLGFCAGEGISQADVDFLLLPPLFQFQRLPKTPQLIPNTLTPHPIALVERKIAGRPVTRMLTAELDDLPFVWAMPTNAACGLTLQNARGEVQPGIFAPILGSARSRFTAGEERTVRWRLWAAAAGWKDAFAAYCLNNAKVRDYREPINASLTDAILNMMDLLLNDEASGWEAGRRGFYDIETATMVKHAAPLALMEAATLSRNEEFWRRRGLPSLEFMLSRRNPGFIRPTSNQANPFAKGQIRVPGMTFGYSGWEGASRLLRGNDPWLAELALPADKKNSWPSSAWPEMLSAARLRPGCIEREPILANAEEWCAHEVFGRHLTQLPFSLFYNISFYPMLWSNLDELEAFAPDSRWQEAAFECAFLTMAGQWSQPRIPEKGEVTVHPDGCDHPNWHVWFKDDKPYRLGWPRRPGDTPPRRVPAWQVSNVGLGFEQPSTYAGATFGQNIQQATWAPHLLRLSAQTNGLAHQLLEAFARNSVIGRFANYPGYYLLSYNDLPFDPRYPYRGPDLTSFYYHHIPVHYAWSMDYLVAEMEIAARGTVAFPWVVQKNYAWFNNRIYTPEAGRVYGDTNAVLWLERGLVTLDTPNVDWLAARSPDNFWLLLLNQTPRQQTFTCRLDAGKIGLRDKCGTYAEPRSWRFWRNRLPLGEKDAATLTLPSRGFAAISWPTVPRAEFPAPLPLADSHRTISLPNGLGEAHIFTIRSPWNRDSLYVVLTTDEITGAQAEFTCGSETVTRDFYPYEASFMKITEPWPSVSIRIRLKGKDLVKLADIR